MVQVQSLITIYLGLSLAPPIVIPFLLLFGRNTQRQTGKIPWKLWTLVPTNLIVSKASYRVLLLVLQSAYLISPPIYFQVP